MGSTALTQRRIRNLPGARASSTNAAGLRLVWPLMVLLCFGATARAASTDDLWETANKAYQAGKFEEAKSDYLQLLYARSYSPSIFYNLGNAWWKLGQRGRAVLNYRRALILDPTSADAEANLRFALQQTGQDPPSELSEALNRYADFYPWIDTVALWIAIFGIVIWWGARGRVRDFVQVVVLLAGITFILSFGLTLWIGRGDKDPQGAIILPGSVDLKIGPARSARIAETVGEGQQVAILKERGEWIECRSQAGVVGWIQNSAAERIIP
ncbi:MAG: tetratricopeptide repeat protein [Verrucomicrobia bacterium]|nr:tetratricopeptide repeat protein [Verrucomicrobiota bacterium]